MKNDKSGQDHVDRYSTFPTLYTWTNWKDETRVKHSSDAWSGKYLSCKTPNKQKGGWVIKYTHLSVGECPTLEKKYQRLSNPEWSWFDLDGSQLSIQTQVIARWHLLTLAEKCVTSFAQRSPSPPLPFLAWWAWHGWIREKKGEAHWRLMKVQVLMGGER